MVTSDAVYQLINNKPFGFYTEIDNVDLNDEKKDGIYITSNVDNVQNKPSSSYYNNIIFVFRLYGNDRVMQIFYSCNAETMYIRRYQAGWSAWKQIV